MAFEQACAEAKSEVSVVHTEAKGRILVVEEQLEKGDEILLEYALKEVVGAGLFKQLVTLLDDEALAIMYWGALHSLCAEDWDERKDCECCDEPVIAKQLQDMILVLHQHEIARERTDAVAELLGIPQRSVELFHCLFQVWCGNSFDCGEENEHAGILYFLPAMLSHSCRPNCVWHYGTDNTFILRARNGIEAGEELTIPYLSPEELRLPTSERRALLEETKHFFCACDRCEAVDTMRTFLCTSCSESVATIENEILSCPCGWSISEEEAIAREHEARESPEKAAVILGERHWLTAQSWNNETVADLQKLLAFLTYHDLRFAGEAPRILERLGDIQADRKSPDFNLAEAAACYEEAANLYLDLFGSDHENHLAAYRKWGKACDGQKRVHTPDEGCRDTIEWRNEKGAQKDHGKKGHRTKRKPLA